MKNLMYVAITAVAVLLIWHMFNKEGRLSRAVENTVDNVSTVLEEKSLPQKPLVIQKEMIEQLERDNREWTSDNINKHPELYLSHCGRELAHFQGKYDAAIIDVNTTINLYQREVADSKEESAQLLRFLSEAHKALSGPSLEYPAKIGVFTYKDADNLKATVLATDEKLLEAEKLAQLRESQIEQLQKTHSDLVEGRERVKKEIQNLDGRIAQAKSKNLTKAVDGLRARMNALLSRMDAIPGGDGVQIGLVNEPSAKKTVEDVFSRRGIK